MNIPDWKTCTDPAAMIADIVNRAPGDGRRALLRLAIDLAELPCPPLEAHNNRPIVSEARSTRRACQLFIDGELDLADVNRHRRYLAQALAAAPDQARRYPIARLMEIAARCIYDPAALGELVAEIPPVWTIPAEKKAPAIADAIRARFPRRP